MGRNASYTAAKDGRLPTGLRSAAAAARHAAVAQAAPTVANLVQPLSRLVLVVRRGSHLPEALRRLIRMLGDAGHLTPQHAQLIARVGAEAVDAAAQVLCREGHGDAAALLDRQARLLAAAAQTGRRAASITPADPRPLAQAQQIHQYLIRHGLGVAVGASTGIGTGISSGLSVGEARRIAQALSAVSTVLADAAWREVARRTWLTPSIGAAHSAPVWAPVLAGGQVPILAERLNDAAAHAPRLTAALALGPAPATAVLNRAQARAANGAADTSAPSRRHTAGAQVAHAVSRPARHR